MKSVSFTVLALIGTATAAAASPKFLHPSFVGCASDGQLGPLPPPKHRPTPSLPAKMARALSYYSGEEGPAVLAPRGWHCVGLYGSNGSLIIVTPEAHRAAEFFEDKPVSIRGPAIQSAFSVGETSGRFAVAEAIDRYFKVARSFAQSVDAEGFSESNPPTGPYTSDILRDRSARSIRLTTPASLQGAGTDVRLLPGNLPIETRISLLGELRAPSLLTIQVRLPSNFDWLTDVILTKPVDGK